MGWVLAGAAFVVVSLILLALVLLSLWRRLKALMREVANAGEKVAAAGDALAQLQGPAASGTGSSTHARPGTPGRRP